jgi:hypothetical protein
MLYNRSSNELFLFLSKGEENLARAHYAYKTFFFCNLS